MPKYSVEIKEIETYIVDGIEADKEIDAIQIAYETIEDENKKQNYHADSDREALVYDDE